MEKFKKISLYCPKWAVMLFLAAFVCLVINIVSICSTAFSDFFNGTVGAAVRFLLAKLTGWLPFSLAETLIICIIPIAVFLAFWGVRLALRDRGAAIRFICGLLAVCSLLYSLFVLTFAPAYRGRSLSEKLGLEREPVGAGELYSAAELLLERVTILAKNDVDYLRDGSSDMGYGYGELNKKLNEAYSSVCRRYSFIQRMSTNVKEVALSELMSYTHITGVYTYFTGEANVNIAFPDYTIPFTMAHEMAHQRGIAREDEANFVAFLVCMESNDPYILYSAYLNIFEYVSNALYQADRQLYSTLSTKKSPEIIGEQTAYSEFFSKYRDSVASEVSGAVNDAYLKDRGQEAGTKSYGLVVDLVVSYYKNCGMIE